VHSKIAKPDDIIAFMKEWDDRCPVVIVPTMYYDTPTQMWRDLKISMVIWANHILRSGIRAMKDTAQHLMEHESLLHIEKELPTVKEIFRLQGMDEYAQWEKTYLPKTRQAGRGILLAASKGANFGRLTDDKPKAMIEVEGSPIITGSVNALRKSNVRDITIVTGYKPDAFTIGTVKYVHNAAWEKTGEVGSLLAAKDKIAGEGELVIGYGDVVARSFVVKNLVESKAPLTVVVDYQAPHHKTRTSIDWARVTPERVEGIKKLDYKLVKIDPQLPPASASGEWIGLLACTGEGSKLLAKAIDDLLASGADIAKWSMPQLLSHIVESGVAEVAVQYIHDNWLDIDDIADLSDLYKF